MSSVVKIYDIRSRLIQDIYSSFIKSHERNSLQTAKNYASRIDEFFQLILGKSVDFVSVQDVQEIKNMDVQTKFVDVLIEKGNTANTIRTKLNSVKSFYDTLLINEVQVNPMVLKVRMKVEVKHHKALSYDELMNLFQFLLKEKDGVEKYLIAKTLYVTGNRKSATFNMTWKDIKKQRDSLTNQDVWVIEVVDKGKKRSYKPISDEFYEELQTLNNGNEKIFSILDKTFERALKKFNPEISIHSLKATAITLGYQMTKDINLCKQLGSHSSMSTTEIYLRDEEGLTNQLSYNASKKIDERLLYNLSHEELLEFISQNEDIKRAILMRLNNKKEREYKT